MNSVTSPVSASMSDAYGNYQQQLVAQANIGTAASPIDSVSELAGSSAAMSEAEVQMQAATMVYKEGMDHVGMIVDLLI